MNRRYTVGNQNDLRSGIPGHNTNAVVLVYNVALLTLPSSQTKMRIETLVVFVVVLGIVAAAEIGMSDRNAKSKDSSQSDSSTDSNPGPDKKRGLLRDYSGHHEHHYGGKGYYKGGKYGYYSKSGYGYGNYPKHGYYSKNGYGYPRYGYYSKGGYSKSGYSKSGYSDSYY